MLLSTDHDLGSYPIRFCWCKVLVTISVLILSGYVCVLKVLVTILVLILSGSVGVKYWSRSWFLSYQVLLVLSSGHDLGTYPIRFCWCKVLVTILVLILSGFVGVKYWSRSWFLSYQVLLVLSCGHDLGSFAIRFCWCFKSTGHDLDS